MARPRVKNINLELVHRLRIAGLGWRTIGLRYYSQTRQDISWLTLKRRYIEVELTINEQEELINNGYKNDG